MNNRSFFTAAAALGAMAAYACASDAANLVWKPKVGRQLHFRAVINFTAGQNKVRFSSNVTHKIKSIRSDGAVVVEDDQTGFNVVQNGADITEQSRSQELLPDPTWETDVVTPRGEVISKATNAPNPNPPRMDPISAFIYPDHPLNAGDAWKRIIKGDASKGTYDAVQTYTFVGAESVQGVDGYKVAVTYTETNAPLNITASGTVWLSKEDGEELKASRHVKNADLGPFGTGEVDTESQLIL